MIHSPKEIHYKIIGRKFKELRKQSHETQEDIAKILEIETTSYSNMERGVERFNLFRIIQLCEYFNILPGDIMNGCTLQLARMQNDILEKPNDSKANNNAAFDRLIQVCFSLSEKNIILLTGIAELMKNPGRSDN